MTSMLIALEITALGMGLVFGAIILLWGMMNLLTSSTADKEPVSGAAESASAVASAALTESDVKARAAAAAVAIALAEQQTPGAQQLVDPPAAIISAWQLGMRTRQMYQKGNSMRRRAR